MAQTLAAVITDDGKALPLPDMVSGAAILDYFQNKMESLRSMYEEKISNLKKFYEAQMITTEYMTSKQVKEFLQISDTTLWRLEEEGLKPCSNKKHGRMKVYRTEEVKEFYRQRVNS